MNSKSHNLSLKTSCILYTYIHVHAHVGYKCEDLSLFVGVVQSKHNLFVGGSDQNSSVENTDLMSEALYVREGAMTRHIVDSHREPQDSQLYYYT